MGKCPCYYPIYRTLLMAWEKGMKMDANKVDMFLVTNGKKLPADKIGIIRERMEKLDDSKYLTLSSIELKDPTVVLIVSILVGELGIDRFMLGEVGLGIIKLLTLGAFGIWWLIDLFLVGNKTKEYNFKELMKFL